MEFNINRYVALLRRDFIVYKKPLFLAILGTVIILAFSPIFSHITDNGIDNNGIRFYNGWYSALILPVGLFLTSVVFWEFKSSAGRLQYLSIPASHLEKVLSRWLYTLVLYPIVITSIIYVLSFIFRLIWPDFSEGFNWVLIKDMLLAYLVLHSIVFMFAIWMNNYVAPKAAIISLLLLLIFAFSFAILIKLIFPDLISGCGINTRDMRVVPDSEFQLFVEKRIEPILTYLMYLGIPLFFWVVSYFKMQEKEA